MNRESKNITIALLLICILTMAVGYSILQQRLNVEGTSNIISEFNIQVTGVREIYKDGLLDTTTLDFTPTTASYGANIQAPGDFAMYEIEIENKGTLAGHSVLSSDIYNTNTYENGVEIGVIAVSKIQYSQLNSESFMFDIMDEHDNNPNLEVYLESGEKAYYYAIISFSGSFTKLPEKKDYSNEVKFDFNQIDINTVFSTKELALEQKTEFYNVDSLLDWKITNAKIKHNHLNNNFTLSFDIERPTNDTNIYNGCQLGIKIENNNKEMIYLDNISVVDFESHYYHPIDISENFKIFKNSNLYKETVSYNGDGTQYSDVNEINKLIYHISCID